MSTQPAIDPNLQTKKYPFELQQGETVLRVTRRHWLYAWPNLLWMFLIAVVPIVLLWLIFDWAGIADEDIAVYIGIGISVLWGGYWIVKLFLSWYAYNHDMWVITDQRIMDVRKPTPLRLQMSSADMSDVLDMSVERGGILGTTFNFGNVQCQTAGSSASFVLSGVPNPAGIQSLIDQTRDRARGTAGRRYQQYDAPPPQYAPAPQQAAPPQQYAPPPQQAAPPPQTVAQQETVELPPDPGQRPPAAS